MARRSALRNRTEAALARALLYALRELPRPAAEKFARGCTSFLDSALPRLRLSAERNLERAYPEKQAAWRAATIDGIYASIARLLVAFSRFPLITRDNIGDWIRYEGFEHYEAAKAKGRGILFATAHLGNWELSAFAHALLTEPMSVVVRPLDNPGIDEIVEHYRGLSGNTLLSKRDFARSIFEALKRNEPVGILVDQNASAENGAFVPFFGSEAYANLACTNLTFAKLAARSGAAVIPGFAIWNQAESRYILKFWPEVAISGDAERDTGRIQTAVETAIREAPDQWLWIHRRWKTRPPGEPSFY